MIKKISRPAHVPPQRHHIGPRILNPLHERGGPGLIQYGGVARRFEEQKSSRFELWAQPSAAVESGLHFSLSRPMYCTPARAWLISPTESGVRRPQLTSCVELPTVTGASCSEALDRKSEVVRAGYHPRMHLHI